MKLASNKVLGLSMGAGALIAAIGLGVQTGDVASDVRAAPDAPAHSSPAPPTAASHLPNAANAYVSGRAGAAGAGG